MAMEDVLMEYYSAIWCNPCKIVRPILDELKAAGWNIEKIDVDQNRSKAAESKIMAMPTFIIYRDGDVVGRIVGARDKSFLLNELVKAAS